eukprot:gb/GECG01016624.1/.p1 GENE.gb/GECG01016624.1/~~gb/GECG01016624.1/.p1  ORF type:complete len:1372 (+),score=192.05 gb/GECG01016624.1/:1-4116(+)
MDPYQQQHQPPPGGQESADNRGSQPPHHHHFPPPQMPSGHVYPPMVPANYDMHQPPPPQGVGGAAPVADGGRVPSAGLGLSAGTPPLPGQGRQQHPLPAQQQVFGQSGGMAAHQPLHHQAPPSGQGFQQYPPQGMPFQQPQTAGYYPHPYNQATNAIPSQPWGYEGSQQWPSNSQSTSYAGYPQHWHPAVYQGYGPATQPGGDGTLPGLRIAQNPSQGVGSQPNDILDNLEMLLSTAGLNSPDAGGGHETAVDNRTSGAHSLRTASQRGPDDQERTHGEFLQGQNGFHEENTWSNQGHAGWPSSFQSTHPQHSNYGSEPPSAAGQAPVAPLLSEPRQESSYEPKVTDSTPKTHAACKAPSNSTSRGGKQRKNPNQNLERQPKGRGGRGRESSGDNKPAGNDNDTASNSTGGSRNKQNPKKNHAAQEENGVGKSKIHKLRISPLVTGPHDYIKVFLSGPCPPKKILYVGLYRVGTRDAHEYITMKNQRLRPDKDGNIPPNCFVKFYMPKKFGCYEFRLFDEAIAKKNDNTAPRNNDDDDFGPNVLASVGPCRVTVSGEDLLESLIHHKERVDEILDLFDVDAATSLIDAVNQKQKAISEEDTGNIISNMSAALQEETCLVKECSVPSSKEWNVLRADDKLEIPVISRRSITRAVQAATSIRGLLSQAMSAYLSRSAEDNEKSKAKDKEIGEALWNCMSSLYKLATFIGSLLDCVSSAQSKFLELARQLKGSADETDESEESLVQFCSRLGYEPLFWAPKEKIALHVSTKCVMDDVLNNRPIWLLLTSSQQKTLARWNAAYCFLTESLIDVVSDHSDSQISTLLATRAANIINGHIALTSGRISKQELPDIASSSLTFDSPRITELIKPSTLVPPEKLPHKASELCTKIVNILFLGNRSSEEAEQKHSLLKSRLKDMLRKLPVFKEGKLDLALDIFGSSGNGFGSNNSDVDMALTRTVLQRKTIKRRTRLIPDFDGASDSLGLRLEETFNKIVDPEELVTEVAACLEENGMESVSTRATARVPIVSFVDPASNLHCDLCAYNPLATQNTALLKSYGDCDERVRPLVFAIKALASHRGMNDASKATLSTYGWILLLLSFLQKLQPPPIPCLQAMPKTWSGKSIGRVSTNPVDILPGVPVYRLKNQGGDTNQPAPVYPLSNADGKVVDGYFYHNNAKTKQIRSLCERNKTSIGELLLEFLWHYSFEFDSRRHVASIRPTPPVPRDITKNGGKKGNDVSSDTLDPEVLARYDFCFTNRFGWRAEVRKEWKADVEGWARKPTFGIEDPFETFYDVAHVLRSGTQHLLLKEMIRIYGIIAATAEDGKVPMAEGEPCKNDEVKERYSKFISADDPDRETLESLLSVLLAIPQGNGYEIQ